MTEYTTPETREVMEYLINETQPQTELDKQLERAEQEKIAYLKAKQELAETLDNQQGKGKPQGKQVFNFKNYLNKINNPVREIRLQDIDDNEVVFFARAPKFNVSVKLQAELLEIINDEKEGGSVYAFIKNYSLLREVFNNVLCDEDGNPLPEEYIAQLEEALPETMVSELVISLCNMLFEGKLGNKPQA